MGPSEKILATGLSLVADNGTGHFSKGNRLLVTAVRNAAVKVVRVKTLGECYCFLSGFPCCLNLQQPSKDSREKTRK